MKLALFAPSAALVAAALLTGCIDIGSGEKVGIVTRSVAGSGVFCKTNEIELMRGGMSGGNGVVGAAFRVTVEDPALFDKLTKAMEDQAEVKIKYREEAISFCRSDSQSHFLTSAEFASDKVMNRTANVAVQGTVAVAPSASASFGDETRQQKINRLLKTQAELLAELAKDSK